MGEHARQIAEGDRFEFGKNWSRFLSVLGEERIRQAETSLQEMLGVGDLAGKRFLDIGSGSGLFSLAARRLGASVHSFDYDPQSVACAKELRRRYFPNDSSWTIEEGSALDQRYLESLGQFDVVYSWGVLHHTGQMWQALEYVHPMVSPGGTLFIAIYNDMGTQSIRWRKIKKIYCSLPSALRPPFAFVVNLPRDSKHVVKSLIKLRPQEYVYMWTRYSERRGMSRWHDIVDWVGGYPYEYAKPQEIIEFFERRGFVLDNLKRTNGIGCNEFVLRKLTGGGEPERGDSEASNPAESRG